MEVEFMPCPTCSEVTVVELPPCADEHGFDCPDRACTMCGTALTVAGVAMVGDIIATSGGGAPRRTLVAGRNRTSRPVRSVA